MWYAIGIYTIIEGLFAPLDIWVRALLLMLFVAVFLAFLYYLHEATFYLSAKLGVLAVFWDYASWILILAFGIIAFPALLWRAGLV